MWWVSVVVILVTGSVIVQADEGYHGNLAGLRGAVLSARADRDIGPIELPIYPISLLFPNLTETDPRVLKERSMSFDYPVIRGTHAYSNSKVFGHSRLDEQVWISIPDEPQNSIWLKYILTVPSVTFDGMYASDLEIFSGLLFLSGEGFYSTTFSNTTLTIEVTLIPTETPSILVSGLKLGFRFRKLDLYAEDSLVNCQIPIWSDIGFDLGLIVETYFPFVSFRILEPILESVLNDVLKDCDLEEMIFEGDFSCLTPEPEVVLSKILSKLNQNVGPLINSLPTPKGEWINPCTNANNNTPPTEQPPATTEEGQEEGGANALALSVASILLPTFLMGFIF